jgi:hypothetical protein
MWWQWRRGGYVRTSRRGSINSAGSYGSADRRTRWRRARRSWRVDLVLISKESEA